MIRIYGSLTCVEYEVIDCPFQAWRIYDNFDSRSCPRCDGDTSHVRVFFDGTDCTFNDLGERSPGGRTFLSCASELKQGVCLPHHECHSFLQIDKKSCFAALGRFVLKKFDVGKDDRKRVSHIVGNR